jgi:hypothetical protein
MIVRRYRDSDLGAIFDLHHRQGLNYDLPPLEEMALGLVIEEGSNITHAVFLRGIVEAYWLFDPAREWKRQTLGRLLVLHKEVEAAAAKAGVKEVEAFVPPTINTPKFEATMLKLGWRRPLWTCYSHDVPPISSSLVAARSTMPSIDSFSDSV